MGRMDPHQPTNPLMTLVIKIKKEHKLNFPSCPFHIFQIPSMAKIAELAK